MSDLLITEFLMQSTYAPSTKRAYYDDLSGLHQTIRDIKEVTSLEINDYLELFDAPRTRARKFSSGTHQA